MAEINDIMFKIAADVAAIIVPLVGTEYNMAEYIDLNNNAQQTVDATIYGDTRTVPPTTISPNRPLLTDLVNRVSAGKACITIECATHDVQREQYTNKPEECISKPSPTLTFTQSGDTVALGGTITAGNVIGLQIGNLAVTYEVLAGDTLDTIPVNLAASAPSSGFPTIVPFGQNFTVDAPEGSEPLVVQVGSVSTWIRPVQYRRRNFDALVWTSNPYDRKFLGAQIETIYDLGQILPIPDGTKARVMQCLGPIDHDGETPENVFVRRVRYLVDFTAIKTYTKTSIVAGGASLGFVPPGGTLADYSAPLASQL